jgi:hypothetical protein
MTQITTPSTIEIEFCLEQIDAWRNGEKATPGMPANGRNYATAMRAEVSRLSSRLRQLRKGIADAIRYERSIGASLESDGKPPGTMERIYGPPELWDRLADAS